MVNFGYACINITLDTKTRTARLETLRNGDCLALLHDLCMQNLDDLLRIIEWNYKNNIKVFRISSGIFPHITNKQLKAKCRYTIDFARPRLAQIGKIARQYDMRLSFHAMPYVKLGSPSSKVVEDSIAEIEMYADILIELGTKFPVIVLHVGGVYGDIMATLNRFYDNFRKLSPRARKLIALENDELVNCDYILPFCEKHNILLVYDVFHNTINATSIPHDELLRRLQRLWKSRKNRIKFHYSEQRPSARVGAHGDYVKTIPQWLFKMDADVMLETKKKELSIKKLLAHLHHTQ